MKFLKFLILSLLVISISMSCKKDSNGPNEPEIIKPKPYFPVYPKSWWKYEINDSAFVTSRVSDDYELHSYQMTDKNWHGKETYSIPKRVPFLDSEPIYGYDKIDKITIQSSMFYQKWPILSEEVGFKYERSYKNKKIYDGSEKLEIVSKTFNGSDSVLTVKGYWVYLVYANRISYQEYTKNIGLTKEYLIDTLNMDTLYKKILVDYHINYMP